MMARMKKSQTMSGSSCRRRAHRASADHLRTRGLELEVSVWACELHADFSSLCSCVTRRRSDILGMLRALSSRASAYSSITTLQSCHSAFSAMLRSHATAASQAALPVAPPAVYSKLVEQFRRHVPAVNGLDPLLQLAALAASPAALPVASTRPSPAAATPSSSSSSSPRPLLLLLGGDQCTGKSTLSHKLAARLQGRTFSAGTLFRQRAKELGISSAELSRRALADPAIDVGIEFELCKLILAGVATQGTLIIEGRQPAVMENFLRATFGRGASFRVRLTCSVREQALRFIEREAPELLTLARAALPPSPPLPSLRAATHLLRSVSHPDVQRICALFEDNDRRDDDDRARFTALYGDSAQLDYRNPSLYDCVIDTSTNLSADTFKQALHALEQQQGQLPPPPPVSKL